MVDLKNLICDEHGKISTGDGKHHNVLIIDDNVDFGATLSILLNLQGFSTTVCDTGLDGIIEGSKNHYDAILLDIRMPVMDGYEACQAIRAEQWGKTIPIIALTGGADRNAALTGPESGFTMYMAKSIDIIGLGKTISDFLRQAA